METILISVIIPTLNEEKCIQDLLLDLVNQTNQQFEVIVVDGKSQDRTKEKVYEFKDKLSLHFYEAERAHLSYQRNYGAEKAKGDYLFFLDADTRLNTNVISGLLTYIENEGGKIYLPTLNPTDPTFLNKFLFSISLHFVKFVRLLGRPLAIGPLILIEKKLFHDIGGFALDTSASEDHNLIIKAYKAGVKSKIVDDVSVFYSTRRLNSHGVWHVAWQYFIFTIETLVYGGVYSKKVHYEMGGQVHMR